MLGERKHAIRGKRRRVGHHSKPDDSVERKGREGQSRKIHQRRRPNCDGAAFANDFSQGYLTPPTSASARSADSQPELPVVKAVFGSAKRLRATLLYSGGVEIDADTSSRELPGGYRVAILTFDNVTLERSGKRYPLGFSNTPPVVPGNANNPAVSNTASAPVLPGLIPGQR